MKAVSFSGNVTRAFGLNRRTLTAEQPQNQTQPSHHVAVIDCSGSMYYDIAKIREVLDRVVTVEDFIGSGVSYSLITYSGRGDVVVHSTRVAAGDAALKSAISGMYTRGLTCISQALDAAVKLAVPGEVTAITLHTDGYANDPGFDSERKALMATASALPAGVFLNTIAYGGYSDFRLLDALANAGGGICVQAADAKGVFNSIRDTTALLAAQTVPVLDVTGNGLIVVCGNGKFVSGEGVVTIRGVKPGAEYQILEFSNGDDEFDGVATAVLARHYLRAGNLNLAKEIVNGFSGEFMRRHFRALTGEQVAAFAIELDDIIAGSMELNPSAPLVLTGTTVLDVLSALDDKAIRIDTKALSAGYRARTVKSLSGFYDENGVFVPNPYSLRQRPADFVALSGIHFSSDAATLNAQFTVPADLVDASGNVVSEIAGIPLDLSSIKAYTIIGCGELNVTSLRVKISKESAFRTLAGLGAVTGSFDPTAVYEIDLTAFPVVAFGAKAEITEADVNAMFRLSILKSFLAAAAKEAGSVDYTAEQVAALREHCLTPALNFSGKSTVPYRDRAEALAKGEIDEVPEYSVTIGTTTMLSVGNLHSANKFMDRYYTVPKVADLIGGAKCERKVLGPRVKITEVDNLMSGIFDSLLGITNTPIPEIPAATLATIRSRTFDAAALAEGKAAVASALETLWSRFRQVVFYVGATGSIPEFSTPAVTMDAETFEKAYPNCPVSKAEKAGTFVVVGNVVLTVTESTRTVPGRLVA